MELRSGVDNMYFEKDYPKGTIVPHKFEIEFFPPLNHRYDKSIVDPEKKMSIRQSLLSETGSLADLFQE